MSYFERGQVYMWCMCYPYVFYKLRLDLIFNLKALIPWSLGIWTPSNLKVAIDAFEIQMSCKYWLTWFLTSHLDSLCIHKDHPNTQKKESGRELKSPGNLNVYCYMSVNRIILYPFLPSLTSVNVSQSSLCLRECCGQSWSLCCNQSAGKEILFPWIVTLSS